MGAICSLLVSENWLLCGHLVDAKTKALIAQSGALVLSLISGDLPISSDSLFLTAFLENSQ